MGGEMKGWNFSRFYSADGSQKSTLETLNQEKKTLETRLLQIPQEIAALNRSISNMQHEYDWLSSLSKSRQRSYEKEHGKHPHTVAHEYKKRIAQSKASITAKNTEKGRIPGRLKELQKQIDTLVQGESQGLSKGLDKESAQALGEIELEKEKGRLEHESKLQQIEADKAQRLADQEAQEQGKSKTGLYIGIGVVILLIIAGIIIYRQKMVKVKVQPLKT